MSKRTLTENDQRITAVEVAGFKSAMAPVRVNFRDITVLAGVNSAGKSTLMQPLLLMKQTMEKPFDPGGLAIDGPLVSFSLADQFLSGSTTNATTNSFSIAFTLTTGWIKLYYGRLDSGAFGNTKIEFKSGTKLSSWTENQIFDIDDAKFQEAIGQRSLMISLQDAFPDIKVKISHDRGMLAISVHDDKSRANTRWFHIDSPTTAIAKQALELIYLPGLRGNPQRNYFISAVGPQYPGRFSDYVASVVHRWEDEKDDRINLLTNNMRRLNLTSRISTKLIDDTRVEVHVGRLPVAARGSTRDTVNIADVGFGVSQTLPVLVAFLAAAPGQMVYVEQPELHLHPRAQVALADIIVQAADRGARVIIETHSSLLILALQTAIAEGRIATDRVSMNWFTRDNKGQTHVAEAEFAKDGSYGDWLVDFDDVESDLQTRYLNLMDRLRAEG